MKLVIGTKNYINSIINNYNFEIKNNEYGKPMVLNQPLFFNKSHTKDISVAVIDTKLCGIDIENIRNYDDIMARKICTPNEYNYIQKSKNKNYSFTLIWVLKESYLKYLGTGLAYPLKKIEFIKNGKLIKRKKDCLLNVLNYKNHIISICRKD